MCLPYTYLGFLVNVAEMLTDFTAKDSAGFAQAGM